MNEIQQKKLDDILNYGYQFNFGDYISKGFELFQKNAGNFIGYALVAGVIIMVANFIPVIGSIGNALILSPALTVGAYLVANKLDRGESTEFSDFFKGFDFIGPLAGAAFVTGLIIVASLIPLFIAIGGAGFFSWFMDAQTDPFGAGSPPGFPFWAVVLIAPAIYFSIAYSWAYMFIAFYNMGFWDAMEMSRKIITKQWFIIFLFAFVVGLIAALGVIALFVGILITFPIMLCAQYAAFADVTRLLEEEEGDIVSHLVE